MNKHRLLQLLSLLLLPLIAPAIQAQSSPSYQGQSSQSNRMARFHWEGIVDGTDLIRVRRRQVETQVRSGAPVQRERYEVTDPLPSTRHDVELEANERRGDRNPGVGDYAFRLTWRRLNDRPGYDDRPRYDDRDRGRGGVLRWSGRVDGRDVINIRGNQLWVEHQAGGQITEANYRFESP